MADNNKKSNFSSLSQGEGRGEALITGAEALMRSLEHQGVKTIFGYPGGSIMPVFDALYDHRKELNHILVRPYLAGNDNDRRTVNHGICNARDSIGSTRSTGNQTNANLA